MFPAAARHVRPGIMVRVATPSGSGARPRGIKPVYFFRKGHDIYFDSELKGILCHSDIDRHLDLNGLNCFLRVNYVPAPYTLVEGIEKLLPGHLLTWQSGKINVEPYWRLDAFFATKKAWSLGAAKEQLDFLLRDSVKDHLIADVPLGLWASGGLDSSTILHYAASARPLKTYSITFRGRSFDESPYIRQAAAYYGTEHSEIDLSAGRDLESAIQEFAFYSDEPSADAGCLPVWYLAKMSSQQVKVALSGEGADELLRRLPDLPGGPVCAMGSAGACRPQKIGHPGTSLLACFRRQDQL